jgi:hypothetical protein
VRYLAATELLYVMYIGSVARNRMSKKLERLLSVMLLPIINKVAHRPVGVFIHNVEVYLLQYPNTNLNYLIPNL